MTPAGSPPTTAPRPPQRLDAPLAAPAAKPWVVRWREGLRGSETSSVLVSLLIHAALLLGLAIPVVEGVRAAAPRALVVFEGERHEFVEFDLVDAGVRGPDRNHESAPASGPPLVSAAPPAFDESVRRMFSKASPGGTSPGGDGGTGGGTGPPGGGGLGLPRHAVQQGSFAAWWVPKIERYGEKVEPGQLPRVGQDYNIYVQVRLPDDRKSFRIEDLSGEIVGTDGYKQLIPDRAWVVDEQGELTRAAGKPLLRVTQGVVQVVFKVQGAGKAGVRDAIRIKSRLLDEEQTLVLEFQPVE